MLSFFAVSTTYLESQHVLYLLPTIFFFSGSRRLQDNLLFLLYIACIFFVMREVCPAVSTITIPVSTPFVHFMRYTFTTSVLT
jgi:hypothetical protein